jgi:hypothetical protein
MLRRVVVAAFLALLISPHADATPGDLASFGGFGNDGVITFGSWQVNDMLLQPDGKILLLGFDPPGRKLLLLRVLPNGETADLSFGSFGRLEISNSSFGTFDAIALQADGKILAVGGTPDHDFLIVRLNSNGDDGWHLGFPGSSHRGLRRRGLRQFRAVAAGRCHHRWR